MPDISMCRDEKCPSRNQCKRYLGKSCLFQSFADFGRSPAAVRCVHFMLSREPLHTDQKEWD
jgi:hypothetical protein